MRVGVCTVVGGTGSIKLCTCYQLIHTHVNQLRKKKIFIITIRMSHGMDLEYIRRLHMQTN